MTAPAEDLVVRRTYPDPVEDIWSALTESDRLGRWFGTWTGDPATGTVRLTVTGEVDAGGAVDDPVDVVIEVCEPPHRLVVDLPSGSDSWHLDVTLSAHGDGTELVLTQRLDGTVAREDLAAGWTWYLARLAAAQSGEPMPPWDPAA
ncbi:SRPBCC domain-containing protein [Actinomycetospora soli]|uniref:SRPBCC domain-containing protein n=1 Tax=Actinomycetospora soli TaxID=2893887 RepID=UPI001E448247|nr:SRPBCC domain-containing protein [Actinomycetospora soli]MCD2189643.1 SRPBCC domain-containing protein [Actinomycetospora soli]